MHKSQMTHNPFTPTSVFVVAIAPVDELDSPP